MDDKATELPDEWLAAVSREIAESVRKLDGGANVPDDIMRPKHRDLTDTERQRVETIKNLGEAFVGACRKLGRGREMSIAVTKAEEAVMWAVKGITV